MSMRVRKITNNQLFMNTIRRACPRYRGGQGFCRSGIRRRACHRWTQRSPARAPHIFHAGYRAAGSCHPPAALLARRDCSARARSDRHLPRFSGVSIPLIRTCVSMSCPIQICRRTVTVSPSSTAKTCPVNGAANTSLAAAGCGRDKKKNRTSASLMHILSHDTYKL